MKIIKHGNLGVLKNICRFQCYKCGCIFEADDNEYIPLLARNEEYYSMGCPYCGAICSGTLVKGENTHA